MAWGGVDAEELTMALQDLESRIEQAGGECQRPWCDCFCLTPVEDDCMCQPGWRDGSATVQDDCMCQPGWRDGTAQPLDLDEFMASLRESSPEASMVATQIEPQDCVFLEIDTLASADVGSTWQAEVAESCRVVGTWSPTAGHLGGFEPVTGCCDECAMRRHRASSSTAVLTPPTPPGSAKPSRAGSFTTLQFMKAASEIPAANEASALLACSDTASFAPSRILPWSSGGSATSWSTSISTATSDAESWSQFGSWAELEVSCAELDAMAAEAFSSVKILSIDLTTWLPGPDGKVSCTPAVYIGSTSVR